jgi:hypothetical protein
MSLSAFTLFDVTYPVGTTIVLLLDDPVTPGRPRPVVALSDADATGVSLRCIAMDQPGPAGSLLRAAATAGVFSVLKSSVKKNRVLVAPAITLADVKATSPVSRLSQRDVTADEVKAAHPTSPVALRIPAAAAAAAAPTQPATLLQTPIKIGNLEATLYDADDFRTPCDQPVAAPSSVLRAPERASGGKRRLFPNRVLWASPCSAQCSDTDLLRAALDDANAREDSAAAAAAAASAAQSSDPVAVSDD